MPQSLTQAFSRNFLGKAPNWYKMAIVIFLVINPILMLTAGPFIAGWVLIAEFIFTLAMALKCYPLPAGGLLAIEAVIMGMTSPMTVYHEALTNFPVILLLIFMVAGIYFMKDFLQYTFTRILTRVQSKIIISLLFCFAGAFLSAFLDAPDRHRRDHRRGLRVLQRLPPVRLGQDPQLLPRSVRRHRHQGA